jgi:hypothetical protein
MFCESEGYTAGVDRGETHADPAQSETPGTSGNSLRENRETPQASAMQRTVRRSPKRKSGMNAGGESSDRIVPAKRVNNEAGNCQAEHVEGRRSAEENPRHGPRLDTEPDRVGAL